MSLKIYNILGQHAATLVDEVLPAGRHHVTWDGTDGHGRELSSGVYFYRLQVAGSTHTKKMMLLR